MVGVGDGLEAGRLPQGGQLGRGLLLRVQWRELDCNSPPLIVTSDWAPLLLEPRGGEGAERGGEGRAPLNGRRLSKNTATGGL